MSRIVLAILLVISSLELILCQDVIVFNNQTKWILSGVRVYAIGFPDTLRTNEQGIVNLDIFPNETPIVFSYPYFTTTSKTKDELAKENYTVYLESSLYNQFSNLSYFTLKEYAYDLPFYIELINPDEQIQMESGTTIKSSEEGISNIQAIESRKIHLSIDGIRLNDEIFRNGVIQKLLTYNSAVFSEIRKVNTPGLLSFSSDALGGVYVYYIKIPPFSLKRHFKVNVLSSYHTSNNSMIGSVNFLYSQKQISTATLFTYGNFGDIVMGKNRKQVNEIDSNYGLHTFIVQRIDDKDSIIPNPNPYKQIGTSYQQIYLMHKTAIKLSKKQKLFLKFHFVQNSRTNLYSATQEKILDKPRYSEALFLPQNKYIFNANYYIETQNFFYDIASINLSLSSYNEYRYTRRFRSLWGLHQIENSSSFKLYADFARKFQNDSRLIYGFSYSSNQITSRAFLKNISTNEYKIGLNRYPNEGSNSNIFSFYFNLKNLRSPYFHYTFAARIDYKNLYAKFSNLFIPLEFDELKFTRMLAPAISVYFETQPFTFLNLNVIFLATTQLPTVDEYTKTMFKDFVIKIPTNDIKPENDLSAKLMLNFNISDNLKLYSHSLFTFMHNYIMLKYTQLNNSDTFDLNGYVYKIVKYSNNQMAYLIGNSTGFRFKQQISSYDSLIFNFNISISKGYNISDTLPLPFIYPMFGFAQLEYQNPYFTASLNFSFNGLKKHSTLSLAGEDFIEKSTKIGFLPWQTLNFSFTYRITKKIVFIFDIENIFDKFYIRYPTDYAQNGRNFVGTIKFYL